MKKFILSMTAVAGLLFACDPMEEIHEEIDAQIQGAPSADVEVRLDENDYKLFKDTEDNDVAKYNNFTSEDDAKRLIPQILNKRFPWLGKGSIAVVTYDLYNPVRYSSATAYTVTTEDYDSQGGNVAKYDNFSSEQDIINFMKFKFPDASMRTTVDLTYKYYAGGLQERTSRLVYLYGQWHMPYEFSSSDYNAMGQRYSNFENHDVAKRNIGIYLEELFPYAEAGDVQVVEYTYTYVDEVDGRQFRDYVLYYTFDGAAWALVQNTITPSLKFGHDGTTWVPDNTIKYELTAADYELVGNGYYKNFDTRPGKAEESLEVRLEKINTILKNNFPNAQEGQKFLVSYNYYNGSNGVDTLYVILENGVYVVFEG